MLTSQDSHIIRRLKRRLQAELPLKRLVAYGSRARGDATDWSDYDVYVELSVPVTTELRHRIREIAWGVSLDAGVVISTLIDQNNLREQPIMKAIEREGVVV